MPATVVAHPGARRPEPITPEPAPSVLMTSEGDVNAALTPARYRFGPLERRGLVAGWRGGQIAALSVALVVAVGVLRASTAPAAIGVALAVVCIGVGAATWPLAGRTAEEWAPDAWRHVVGTRCTTRRRGSPFGGMALLRVEVVDADEPGTAARCAGVLHDRRNRTFTAVLGASASGFVLLGPEDKARRVEAWAGVLASLARQSTAVHRLQWIERVDTSAPVPAPPHGAGPERPSSTSVAAPDPARASYEELLQMEGSAAPRHQVLVAVSVHAGESARAVKACGGGDLGACRMLLREVAALRRRLSDAAIDVGGALTPELLTASLRTGVGPLLPGGGARPSTTAADGGEEWPWPMGMAAEWGRVRVDGEWVATYWVAEWPRTDVGPDFLGPLLLSSDVGRTVSVVMKPLGPIEAARQIERARTADIADAELRRRGGFLSSARRRREEEVLARREVEVADGHAQFQFSGYVSVRGAGPDALEAACGRIEQAAAQSGLQLRRCYGDQVHGFMCTLPLGRGLS